MRFDHVCYELRFGTTETNIIEPCMLLDIEPEEYRFLGLQNTTVLTGYLLEHPENIITLYKLGDENEKATLLVSMNDIKGGTLSLIGGIVYHLILTNEGVL